MSLITTASAWTNDNLQSKKRIPTMKRVTSGKIKGYQEEATHSEVVQESMQTLNSNSIEETEKANQENSERIKNLINKLATDNVGNKLADYQPMEHPNIQPTKQVSDTSHLTMDPEDLLPQTLKPEPNNFGSNDISLGNLSNYNDTYNQSVSNNFEAVPIHRSIYSSGGVGNDNRLIEKLNYMIHLLEEQQMEKTANITEEFILYTFLGVFVIYVIDSFTRSGKYVR
jgi:hypothetical protein